LFSALSHQRRNLVICLCLSDCLQKVCIFSCSFYCINCNLTCSIIDDTDMAAWVQRVKNYNLLTCQSIYRSSMQKLQEDCVKTHNMFCSAFGRTYETSTGVHSFNLNFINTHTYAFYLVPQILFLGPLRHQSSQLFECKHQKGKKFTKHTNKVCLYRNILLQVGVLFTIVLFCICVYL